MLERFEQLLKETIGLDAASIGMPAVERAVLTRAGICGLSSLPVYWARVSSDAGELQALIEAIIVPETWFFRDREAFIALAHMARAGRWSIRRVPCGIAELRPAPPAKSPIRSP